jgi:hypothetical protein
MTNEELQAIIENISILDRKIIAREVVIGHPLGWHLQVTYHEADIYTGAIELQKSRKWLIEPDATESDVVETAFSAIMRSYDHVVKEHFLYKGKRVYSPHFDIADRLKMAEGH